MNDKATILAVDDTPGSLALLVELLTESGFQVHPADSGELALAAVIACPPDLILLDIRMKGIDGLEVCRRLKTNDDTRHIPIILISAFADEKESLEGLQLGAVDYINKPFRTEELLARIKTHLALSRANSLIEQQVTALRQANEQLHSEIDARKRVEKELRQSLDRAERSRMAMLSTLEDQKKAKAALVASEERFRGIFEHASVGKSLTAPDGRLLVINKAFADMLGYTVEELERTHFAKITHPDDIAASNEGVRSLLNRECVSHRMEKRYLRKDGSYVWADVSIALIRDQQGAPNFFITTMLDITARKVAEAEQKRLSAQLFQAQKMEAVGRLASGVAHDFRNLLSVILGYSDIVLRALDPTDPIYANIQDIQDAGNRSVNLIRQLLAFARKQNITPVVLDLNDAIKNMMKLLAQLIGEDIELCWIPSAAPQPVFIDPAQIDQILANLATNARDAIPGVGKIIIETRNADIDETYASTHVNVVPGKYVVLSVTDNGCGMDQETTSHIFEPFFTTKPTGKGTGLGLATVFGIASQNKGFVNVYSEPGKGTTFKVYLPAHDAKYAVIKEKQEHNTAPTGTETILLVDDQQDVLTVTQKIVESLGYNVLVANGPDKAIQVASEYAGNIHLLMTDVVMPKINGRDLCERISALRPGLKCLFVSGYTGNILGQYGFVDATAFNLVEKPFDVVSVATKLREVLSQP